MQDIIYPLNKPFNMSICMYVCMYASMICQYNIILDYLENCQTELDKQQILRQILHPKVVFSTFYWELSFID